IAGGARRGRKFAFYSLFFAFLLFLSRSAVSPLVISVIVGFSTAAGGFSSSSSSCAVFRLVFLPFLPCRCKISSAAASSASPASLFRFFLRAPDSRISRPSSKPAGLRDIDETERKSRNVLEAGKRQRQCRRKESMRLATNGR